MTDQEPDDTERGIVEQIRSTGPVIGGAAVALAVLGLGLGIFFVPRIEGALFPIFTINEISPSSVHRVGQRLCWIREGYKRRAPALTDVDVDVDYISAVTGLLAHQPTPALYDGETGEELTSDSAPPPGPFHKLVCLELAKRIKADQPVQVRQVAWFQSVTGLYDVPVRFPVVVDPLSAAPTFANAHDRALTPAKAVAGPRPTAPQHRSDTDTLDDVRKGLAEMDRKTTDPGASISERFPVHVDTTLSEHDAARVDQSGRGNSDHSRRETLRRLISRALDDEDRDALGSYDPDRK